MAESTGCSDMELTPWLLFVLLALRSWENLVFLERQVTNFEAVEQKRFYPYMPSLANEGVPETGNISEKRFLEFRLK